MLSESINELRQALHPGAFVATEQLPAYAATRRIPACTVTPVNIAELQTAVAKIAEQRLGLVATGAGARMHMGRSPLRYDIALCTRDLDRVIAHEAADLTITVEAGCSLTTVNGILARAGQWIPVDPALPDRTTIGGLIATDACGPLRYSQGKVRDLLIGVAVVLGDGRLVRGGGRVVKNVAGYDLMKLFTGSWGTLGIVVEATFKVRPRPPQTRLLFVSATDVADAAAIALQIAAAALAPLYVEIVNAAAAQALMLPVQGCSVLVAFAGSAAEVEIQVQRLPDAVTQRVICEVERIDLARVYTALRDWPLLSAAHNYECGATISVLPSRLPELLPQLEASCRSGKPVLTVHAGSASICLRSKAPLADAAAQLHDWHTAARQAGGYAFLDLIPAGLQDEIDPWSSAVPGIELMRGIKGTMDPHNSLSPGRFVGGI